MPSEAEPSSEPPRKRRRIIANPSNDESSEATKSSRSGGFSSDSGDDEGYGYELTPPYRSKYDAVLHEPAYVEPERDAFVTQLEQAEQSWSSPTRIRGPRWQKSNPVQMIPPDTDPPLLEHNESNAHSNDAEVPNDEDEDENTFGQVDFNDFEEIYASATITPLRPATIAAPESQNLRQTTLFGTRTEQRNESEQSRAHNWPLTSRNEERTHHKINDDAMQKWIFPLNVGSIREYQYNIVHKALFNNVLVALPTGLGKTFIAATVMMNWFKWTKDAQIVFMAPTKPLVFQQVDACYHIAGIPRSQTTLMTGEVPSHIRAEEWQIRRVFFMTPQTLINDLRTGIADPKRLVLLVVDEAHKATGNYAYVEVVRFLRRFNESVRILALTATPGSTVESVQSVIDGLDIARVEIRTEESIDIQAFVHRRNTELEIFENSEEIEMCLEMFSNAVQPVLNKLCGQNAFWNKDPKKLTTFGLLQAQKQYNSSPAARSANFGIKGMINACFSVLQSLAHNLELLRFHGIGPFYQKMKHFQGADTGGKYAAMVRESEPFMTMMSRVRAWINQEDFVGHPKLEYLNSVVLNHFLDAESNESGIGNRPTNDTRVMIFAHYRDSAEEICRVLNRHASMVRAHVFVGQSSTKDSDGMDQKTQIEIIKKFKEGTYNTLVATMIGEEGLDIGEVDLIVCYDCSRSPIRMLQRMGRTGRKRAGKIVMLLMRDKEERDFRSAKDNYQKMQQLIERGEQFSFHDDRSRRIVPKEIIPTVSKEFIEIPIENTQPGTNEPTRRRGKPKKKAAKKFHMPDGVETGFQFLGGKQKTDGGPNSSRKRRRLLDAVDAPSPRDSEVFLNEQQVKDLDEHYAWCQGETSSVVANPSLTGYAGQLLRSCAKPRTIAHSQKTLGLMEAFKVAAGQQRYETVPSEPWTDPRNGKSASAPIDYVSASQEDDLPNLSQVVGTSSKSLHKLPVSRNRRVIPDEDGSDPE